MRWRFRVGEIFLRKGLTLVELLLAALLVGVVGLGMGAIISSSHNFMLQSAGMATTQGEASYALEHLKRYVSLANNIIPYNPTGTPPVSSSFAIRYDHRSITALTATPLDSTDDEWDYYGYDAVNKILYYKRDFVPGASANPADPGFAGGEVIARNVTALTFTLTSPAQMDVDITVTKVIGTQTRTSHVTSSISPRGMVTN